MRHLVGGQPFASPGEHLTGRGIVTRTQYDEGNDLLFLILLLDADDRGVGNRDVFEQHAFDLGGGDVVDAGLQDLLPPAEEGMELSASSSIWSPVENHPSRSTRPVSSGREKYPAIRVTPGTP